MLDNPLSSAYSVNREGTIIAGITGESYPGSIYRVDGPPTTTHNIGYLRDGTYSIAEAVSGLSNNLIIAGWGTTTGGVKHAFRWKYAEGMLDLGVLDNDTESLALDIARSGIIVVGCSRRPAEGGSRATRWNLSGQHVTIHVLNAPEEAPDCVAHCVDDSGNVIAGTCKLSDSSYTHAVCWLGGTTEAASSLNCLGDHSNAMAYAVSGDGNVIVGSSTEPGNPDIEHAVYWRRRAGSGIFDISNLGVRPDPFQNHWKAKAYGVSHDGGIIVGTCQSASGSEAFIWRDNTSPKVQKLANAATYKRSNAWDVTTTTDGTIIVVGDSSFCETNPNGGRIAVCWENLSIKDLHFPS